MRDPSRKISQCAYWTFLYCPTLFFSLIFTVYSSSSFAEREKLLHTSDCTGIRHHPLNLWLYGMYAVPRNARPWLWDLDLQHFDSYDVFVSG